MNIQKRIGPFIKDTDSVSKIMHRYTFAFLPVILFVMFKHGILPFINGYTNIFGILYPLIFMAVGSMGSILSEEVFLIVFKKLKNKDLIDNVIKNYSYLPGFILSLILPINTPLAILFTGSIFGSIIGKMIFGGFGNNLFNESILASVFIYGSYGNLITLADYEIVKRNNLFDYLIGNVIGSLGTTSIILMILPLIYLIITKTIKWRVSIFYIITFILLGIMSGLPFYIPLSIILFVATFLTNLSPVTNKGSILYGITLGIVSFILYYTLGYVGILISILILNMFIFLFDKIGSYIEFNKLYYIFFVIVIVFGFMTGIFMNTNKNISDEVINYEYIY